MRTTRDLRRRRMSLRHPRAALLPHVPQTHWPDHLPEIGTKLADQGHRTGGAERVPDPAGQHRIAVDRAWSDSSDRVLRERAWSLTHTAPPQDAHPWSLLQTGPGMGTMLRVGVRSESQDRQRCPRGQEVVSSCRLVTGATASAGQR
jgi:hypothetical protein